MQFFFFNLSGSQKKKLMTWALDICNRYFQKACESSEDAGAGQASWWTSFGPIDPSPSKSMHDKCPHHAHTISRVYSHQKCPFDPSFLIDHTVSIKHMSSSHWSPHTIASRIKHHNGKENIIIWSYRRLSPIKLTPSPHLHISDPSYLANREVSHPDYNQQ